jgi:hypothetical protein
MGDGKRFFLLSLTDQPDSNQMIGNVNTMINNIKTALIRDAQHAILKK